MTEGISALNSLLQTLQQQNSHSSGLSSGTNAASGVQNLPSPGQLLPSFWAGNDNDSSTISSTSTATATTSAQLPSQQFSSQLLSALLGAQNQQATPTSVAQQLINDINPGGNGTLSLAQVDQALGLSSASSSSSSSSSSSAAAQVAAEFQALTNGTGTLTASDLASAVSALEQQAQDALTGASGHHHHHHHHHGDGETQSSTSASSSASSAASSAPNTGATTAPAVTTVASTATPDAVTTSVAATAVSATSAA